MKFNWKQFVIELLRLIAAGLAGWGTAASAM